MDYKFINAMTSQIKINSVAEDKAKKWTTEAKQEHVDKLANINVPQEYEGRYKQLPSHQAAGYPANNFAGYRIYS